MTDKELLELAAKAAGIDVRWYQGDCLRVADKCNGFAGRWNPLTDDGDALRLAVKLRMDVEWLDVDTVFVSGGPCIHVGVDPYAATRRAIVRAAAEIGREMK